MSADTLVAPDSLVLSGADPYPIGMDLITDPAKLPADRSTLSDDTLIVPVVWAALQGVKVETVYRNKTAADRRRAEKASKPGDMPATDEPHTVGQTPVWTMGTYRAWDKSRPGKGAGAGRPVGSGQGERARVRLPIQCPHCKHEITAADMGLGDQADGREAVAKLRADVGRLADTAEREAGTARARRRGGQKRSETAGKAQ